MPPVNVASDEQKLDWEGSERSNQENPAPLFAVDEYHDRVKLMRAVNSAPDTVTIVAGGLFVPRKEFSIHKILLCLMSRFIQEAYQGKPSERHTGRLESEYDSNTWEFIQTWLYSGIADYGEEQHAPLEPKTDAKRTSRNHQGRLIQVYICAFYLKAPALQDFCISELAAELRSPNASVVDIGYIRLAFEETPPDGKLCQFLIRSYACIFRWAGARWFASKKPPAPVEFLAGLLKSLSDLAELTDNAAKLKVCTYHEHKNSTLCDQQGRSLEGGFLEHGTFGHATLSGNRSLFGENKSDEKYGKGSTPSPFGLFAAKASQAKDAPGPSGNKIPTPGGILGFRPSQQNNSLFGAKTPREEAGLGITVSSKPAPVKRTTTPFGANPSFPGGTFGSKPQPTDSLFSTTPIPSESLFGTKPQRTEALYASTPLPKEGLFGVKSPPSATGIFGAKPAPSPPAVPRGKPSTPETDPSRRNVGDILLGAKPTQSSPAVPGGKPATPEARPSGQNAGSIFGGPKPSEAEAPTDRNTSQAGGQVGKK